jgi:hypothetical protein
MGIAYNTSTIRDGLVLYLDAANSKSYSSGTAWNDLSGSGNHGTLVNGVGYSTNNKGAMVFDGVNDRTETNMIAPFGTSLITFEACIFYEAMQVGNIISKRTGAAFGYQQISLFVAGSSNGSSIGHKLAYYHSGGNTRSGITDDSYNNKWHHVCLVSETDSNKLYVDGNLVHTGVISAVPNLTLSPPLSVGSGYDSNDTYINHFNGSIGNAKVYNRALTEAEIKQNFEATRGRYGI